MAQMGKVCILRHHIAHCPRLHRRNLLLRIRLLNTRDALFYRGHSSQRHLRQLAKNRQDRPHSRWIEANRPLSASDSRRHKSQCWPSMTAPPCTQNRSYLEPPFPSLWASAPKQTHPLKCPPERRFAPARLPHPGPLNTAKVGASSDRACLHPVPVCSQTCSANSRGQALLLQLWLQFFRSLQIASCSFSFASAKRCPRTIQGPTLSSPMAADPGSDHVDRPDAAAMRIVVSPVGDGNGSRKFGSSVHSECLAAKPCGRGRIPTAAETCCNRSPNSTLSFAVA